MSATTEPLKTTIEASLAEPTLCHAFLRVAAANADHVALSDFGSHTTLTYGQWATRARAVAGGLASLGVGHGDRVGLLLGTRLAFHVVDMGVLLLGAVPYSMYTTSPVAQLAPCVANAEPRVLITEAALAERARALQAESPVIEHLVVIDGTGDGERDLAWLEALCPADFAVEATAARVTGDDLCSLVYTSGTTGAPKGVPYLHRCLMQTMASIHGHVPVSPGGRVISYLPMAHIAERMFGHYAGFVFGCQITSLGDPTQLGAALRAVRPTRFFGVPRIWEKLLAGVHRALGEAIEPEQATVIRAAWERAVERVEAEQARAVSEPQSPADAAALAPLPAMLGLDAAEWLGVAGAPAGRDTLVALHALGLPVNELYGMSETIIVSTSPPHDVRIGTCGVPLIAQVLAIGDRRPYNVALIVLDRDGLEAFRRAEGIEPADFSELARDPRVLAAVADAVQAGNMRLARVEQIKRHAVLDHDWTPGGDELTPTAKLKRKPIEQRYASLIEELYA